MSQITLVYEVQVGLQDPMPMAVKVAAIPITQEWEFLQLEQVSDNTVIGAGKVTRTVVLQTNAVSDEMFLDSDDLKAATRKLLSGVLGAKTPGLVATAEPVVA